MTKITVYEKIIFKISQMEKHLFNISLEPIWKYVSLMKRKTLTNTFIIQIFCVSLIAKTALEKCEISIDEKCKNNINFTTFRKRIRQNYCSHYCS